MFNDSLVSVIIPTFNSEKTLERCLESVKNQSYKNIEIIVVDKFSKDRTVEIARKYTRKVFQIKASERSEQKNFGAKKAKGEYLLFIDSDMELTKNVIKDCVDLCSKEKIGGIIIPERSIGRSYWVRVRDFERSFYANTPIESARFFPKDLVIKVNGFDESVVFFEENTLPQKIEKLGYKVNYRISSEIIHNEYNFSFLKWMKKKFYYGKTLSVYKNKFGDYAKKQTSIFYRFSIFLKNKKFYSKPILASSLIFFKLMEYFSVVFGSLASKVKL
ncbi:MAG: glycosyltransferase [Candidatus Aenigmatarchaeota archaeon]